MVSEFTSNPYLMIRSSQVESLQNWFKTTTAEPKVLFQLLGNAYDELNIKNVPVSSEMRWEVEWKLGELQFSGEKPEAASEDSNINFKIINEHLNVVCELIRGFLDRDPTNISLSFISDAKFIALNLQVLKRRLNFTYKKLPWEEMEFFMLILIFFITNSEENELTYELVIDTKTILVYLRFFLEELLELKSWFCIVECDPGLKNKDKQQLKAIRAKFEEFKTTEKGKPRKQAIQAILKKCPQFTDFYNNRYYILKDFYSLKRIKYYVDIALSVDLDEDPIIGQLVIERALQVAGEYLKNEKDSPNISEQLYNILILFVDRNLQKVLGNVRDMLSHSQILKKRLNLDINIFKSIQFDFKLLKAEIFRVLVRRKIDASIAFSEKIISCQNIDEIPSMRKKFITIIEQEELINVPSLFHLKELIMQLWENVKDTSLNDDRIINFILNELDNYGLRLKSLASNYKAGTKAIFHVLLELDLKKIKRVVKSVLCRLKNSIFHEPIEKTGMQDLKHLLNVFSKSMGLEEDIVPISINRDYGSEFDKLKEMVIQICQIIGFDLVSIYCLNQSKLDIERKNSDKRDWEEDLDIFLNKVADMLESRESESFLRSIEQLKAKYFDKIKLLEHISHKDFLSILNSMTYISEEANKQISNSFKKTKLKNKTKERIINLLPPDDYGLLIKNLKNAKNLEQSLNAFNTFYSSAALDEQLKAKIISESEKIKIAEMTYLYELRLSTLETICDNNNITNNENTISVNGSVMAALETLILDLTEYIVNIGNLGDCKTFLIEKLPLLSGKGLRNHLAHHNMLTHILPYNTFLPLLVYALGLIDLKGKVITEHNTLTIGNRITLQMGKCRQDIVKTQDELFIAIENNNFEHAMHLIEAGADIFGKNGKNESTLDVAVKNNSMQFIEYLIENLTNSGKHISEFVSPCLIAKDVKTFNYFLDNTNLNIDAVLKHSNSWLHVATQTGQLEIVRQLLTKPEHKYNKNDFHETALHIASANGFLEIVELLLKDDPTLIIDEQTTMGCTPLILATAMGHYEVVQELIKHKANVLLKTDKNFHAFHFALRHGHVNIIKVLLEFFRDIPGEVMEALSLACGFGHAHVVNILISEKGDLDLNGSLLYKAATYGHCDIIDILLIKEPNLDLEWKSEDHKTTLHRACKFGYTEVVQILLEYGANIEACDEKMMTPLHYAFSGDHLEVIELLIDKEANIDAFTSTGFTPFLYAVLFGHGRSVKYFLEKYPQNQSKCFTEKNKFTALHIAAYSGYVDMVRLLLSFNANVIAEDSDLNTPLHFACLRHTGIEVVKVLVDNDDINIDLQNRFGETALHTAALYHNTDIAEVLLAHRADVDKVDNAKSTPLHIAASRGYVDIATSLLEKMQNVNILDETNETPLHKAAANGCTEIVQMLLEKGAKTTIVSKSQMTPIYNATFKGNFDVVKLLLKYKSEGNNCYIENIYPLAIIAIRKRYEDIAIFLLENGASPNHKISDNNSIISLAITNGLDNVISKILSMNLVDINEPCDAYGRTPLVSAFYESQQKIAMILLQQNNINVNISATNGVTALHGACISGFADCVEKLLLLGANVNAKAEGFTVLHCAVEAGDKKIVQMLLEKSANVNLVCDVNQRTALHYAASYGDFEMIKLLVKFKAKVDILDIENKSPLSIARSENYEDIARFLLEISDNAAEGRISDNDCV